MSAERKRIARIFKMRGLQAQSSAIDALLNVLRREQQNNDDTLFAIIDEVKDRMIQDGQGTNVVTTSLLEEVVAELSRDGRDVTEEAVQMLDAFKTPRLDFDTMRKNFNLVEFGKEKRTVYGEAVDKVCIDNCVEGSACVYVCMIYMMYCRKIMMVHLTNSCISHAPSIFQQKHGIGGHVQPTICTNSTKNITSRYIPT